MPVDSEAQWIRNGNPVKAGGTNQYINDIMVDDGGGLIIVWVENWDYGSGEDIYIQRIDTLGRVCWAPEGVPVCTSVGGQDEARLVPDGSGGAIVFWEDHRRTPTEIYTQRIDASGNILWALDGISVTSGLRSGYNPEAVTDGAGGAIVTFSKSYEVYAQRIDSDGNALWTSGGVLVAGGSTSSIEKYDPALASDGAGGAILIWMEYYWHPNISWAEVAAQHVNSSGSLGFSSPMDVSDGGLNQGDPAIAGDGSGGAWISWTAQDGAVYARHLDTVSQSMSFIRFLYPSGDDAWRPSISADGSGGAIVAWTAQSSTDRVIRARGIDSGGSTIWPETAQVSNSDAYLFLSTCTWTAGGILTAWKDHRTGEDIYVQAMDTEGNPLWGTDGFPACTDTFIQREPHVVSLPGGAAIVAWNDYRGGDIDVYAMLVHPDLHFPVLSSVADTSVDVGDTLVIQLFATDPDPWDTITYSTDAADVLPSSFEFDADAGLFSWIPHSGEAGDYQLIFGADDSLYKVQDTVLVSVFEDGNRPPVISAIEDQYIYGGDTLAFSVSFSDPDGDEVSLSIDEPRIAVHDSVLIWLTMAGDTGTWHCAVTATDGTLEAEQEVKIKVLPYYPEGPQHDMMVANIHPHFEWVESNNIVWSTADGGYMTSGGNYFRIAVVSGRAFRLDEPLEAIFRIRSYADARSYFGFTTVSPETSDFDLKKVEWGVRCDEFGYIRPVWAETNDYWEQIRLPIRMFFDCRMLLDATEGSITFTFEQVDSAEAPLSDFVDPFFEVVESQILPDSCYIQLNTYNDRGRYYDLWFLQDGSETATMLVSSEASSYAEGIDIRWQVSEFTPREHFLIERSSGPDEDFLSVEQGAITGDGIRFEYADRNAEPGVSYRYHVYLIGEEGGTVLFEAGPIKLPPVTLALYQNFPNPFNPSTTIGYYLPEKCHVILGIFDVSGKRLATLTDDFQDMGQYAIEWNGQDLNSNPVSSGIYFYRLKAGKETISKKMVLLR